LNIEIHPLSRPKWRDLRCARSKFIGFVPHSVRNGLSAGWNFFEIWPFEDSHDLLTSSFGILQPSGVYQIRALWTQIYTSSCFCYRTLARHLLLRHQWNIRHPQTVIHPDQWGMGRAGRLATEDEMEYRQNGMDGIVLNKTNQGQILLN
jgi:hypothetical protein